MNDSPIVEYYSDRAGEYDEFYEIPELQSELESLKTHVRQAVSGHDVFEIACGTGYWTKVMTDTANSVVASDAGRDVLQVAKPKLRSEDNIELIQSDAYNPPTTPNTFSAGFAGSWWSHIPKERIHEFLQTFHSQLEQGAQMCFVDSISVNEELHTDEAGNRYVKRELNDGTEYTIIKNVPEEVELREMIAEYGSEIEFQNVEYLWYLSYHLNPEDAK